jgi:hypothetical protein
MDVLFGLCNPDLTNFVLLLQVYDQLVLSLNDVSVFFDGIASVIKPLFEVLDFLSLNLVQNF